MAVTASRENPASRARPAASVVLLICANSTRETSDPASTPQRGRALGTEWPVEVDTVSLPCTGKIQPEHLLKAFEAGADLVCVLGCEPDNCHCLEGSRRAAQRVRFVQAILDEIGLGGDRLLMFHLPGTAREDMGLARRPGATEAPCLEAIRDEITARLKALGPSPLRTGQSSETEAA